MAIEAKKYPMPTQEAGARVHNFDEVALGYHRGAGQAGGRALPELQKHAPACRDARSIFRFLISLPISRRAIIEGAYQVIAQDSALPAVCGRVCPQESQCESKCTLGVKFEPVAIGRLERFVADWHHGASS